MGNRTVTVTQVDKADDAAIKNAATTARTFMSNAGVPMNYQPDVEAIKAAITKTKKPALWQATLSDLKGLEFIVTVAGKKVDYVVGANLDALGQKKWRASLVALMSEKLVTGAELAAWDAKHPDPDLVAKVESKIDSLTKELTVLNMQIKRLQDAAKPKLEELQKLQKQFKALGGK